MSGKFVLLEDTVAYKQNDCLKTFVDERLLKGTLLVRLTGAESSETQQYFTTPLNYRKYSDSSIKLYCKPEHVLPLNDEQFSLLLGVKYSFDRYKILDTIPWVEKLKVGYIVCVTIPFVSHPLRGVIQYIGPLPGENGTRFGIEFLERRGDGNSDGVFKNREYFKCDHNCAVFVAMDKLSVDSRSNARLSGVFEPVQPLKLGDMVTFYDRSNNPVNGVVRWIGQNREIMRDGSKIVGIETNQRVSPALIPGNLLGMKHLFTLNNSNAIQVFLPINLVFNNDVPLATNTSTHPYNTRSKNEMHLTQGYNQKGHFETEFVSQRTKHYEDLEHRKKQEETTKRFPEKTPQHYTNRPEVYQHMDPPVLPPRPTVQKPRTEVGDNIYYNLATSVPYNHRSRDLYRQMSHDEIIPEPVGQSDPYRQPHQQISHGNPYNLEVGSMILYGDPPHSGVIKWIGYPPASNGLLVGVEMDDHIKSSSDGVWNGIKYFDSQPGKGLFLPITHLKPDDRFGDGGSCAPIQPNRSKDEVLSPSYQLDKAATQSHHDVTQLEDRVKQLQIDHNNHGDQLTAVSTSVDQLQQSVNESSKRMEALEKVLVQIQASNEYFKNQLSLAQHQLSGVQKSNEMLQESNAYLQNQLSLTQQQLLGVQSMMTCSRLWVVSHDQFTIGREIGRGSWASVHEATFRGATVAAKRLHQIITVPRTRQLFQREMEIALQCQHQNVITFLGATLEGTPVILMELMDTSLRSAYEQGNIKDHQVLGILHDIASALHFLHTRPDPVIHRDVSSANVLLKALYNDQWLAKLGDLGTAKIQRLAATAGPGAAIYGAPEAANPSKHSSKMDVYSFGVLVPETLTKTLPYENLDSLKVHVQQQFPQYHQLVTSCTNQQSSDRPTMYDVIKELDRIYHQGS